MPTKKKPTTKRRLTQPERTKLRKYQRQFMSYVTSLIDNENICTEDKKVLRSMRSDLLKSLSKSSYFSF